MVIISTSDQRYGSDDLCYDSLQWTTFLYRYICCSRLSAYERIMTIIISTKVYTGKYHGIVGIDRPGVVLLLYFNNNNNNTTYFMCIYISTYMKDTKRHEKTLKKNGPLYQCGSCEINVRYYVQGRNEI